MADLIPIPMGVPWDPWESHGTHGNPMGPMGIPWDRWDPKPMGSHAHLYFRTTVVDDGGKIMQHVCRPSDIFSYICFRCRVKWTDGLVLHENNA